VVTFEQLGVDRLYVDEAHGYKNLFLFTKMRNVAGLSTSEAQKSSDMLLKCRYIDEITGNKGVVFATGTPVSNSMTELYTMMRYLQHDTLRDNGLAHFDCWASTFGETVTAIELAPEGTGYRARTRFAKFFNLPELMTMFREVADIKTAD
jgi:N12 class adenine-specific DNA methylase